MFVQVISDLERSIAKYKEEYAVLIAEVQAIKSDLASVEKKVGVKWQSSQYFTTHSHSKIFLKLMLYQLCLLEERSIAFRTGALSVLALTLDQKWLD